MKTAMKTAMMTSISEVLETMFFLSLEMNDQITLESSGLLDAGKNSACRIEFKGSFSGSFFLLVPEKLLLNMAVSFMGLTEDEITDEHTFGTIKEAINMLAGSTFTSYDDAIEFQLTIPEIIDNSKVISSGKGDGEEEVVVIAETTEGYLIFKAVIESKNG